jgi:flagellar motor switch protein FliN/FliY
MSDTSLSQAEIDALLSGGGGGASEPVTAPTSNAAVDTKPLQDFLGDTVNTLSANLSAQTTDKITFAAPTLINETRDALLDELPDTVTSVKVDYTSGFPGEHIFLFSEAAAKALVGQMTKEDNVTLDDMALSVVGEAVSQISGAQITALTGKTGNKSIAATPPQATNIPKATVALPEGAFTVASYKVSIAGAEETVWEVFGNTAAGAISAALATPPAPPAPPPAREPSGGGRSQPSMQSVQFPTLGASMSSKEQGNISLLMDVSMEMTVELGRTRKQIKEILAMGEGTIIELDKLAGEPVDILVNHKLIAHGEVVVIDENFGVRVTTIVSPAERMPDVN